ncbi:MAG TPA: serine hydrolase domain-containing protein, partial [Lysobacter sp.]|nr:serine hydrolase domain-containing protein [Lysobacter sp.]
MTSSTTQSGIASRLQRLLVCLCLSFSPAAVASDAGAIATVPPRSLHAAMAEQLEAQALQGAVWALVTEDGAITVDAAGTKDASHGQALRIGDRVHVGSVAKTLLATGVLRLVSQRRLALDTPVSELLPAVAFDNPWAASDPVRVRHLLDHTAGLDDARFSQVFSLKP